MEESRSPSSLPGEGHKPGDHFMAGERGKGQRGDELLGRFGHHYVHIQRLALQGSHHFGRLISGNATRDTDRDLHSDDCTTGGGEAIGLDLLVE